MTKKLVFLMVIISIVTVGLLLTFEITMAVERAEASSGDYALAKKTKTPTPTRTKTPKYTKTPKPTNTPAATSTPRPTGTPNIEGTKGSLATPVLAPPAELSGGYVGEAADDFSLAVDPFVGKTFVWNGFPGVSRGLDEQGYYVYAKNRLAEPTLWGYWYIFAEQSGYYDVYAYIPVNPYATHSAQYQIVMEGEPGPPLLIDQLGAAGQWANLGTYYFTQGEIGNQYIVLNNQTTEDDVTSVVLFATIHLSFRP